MKPFSITAPEEIAKEYGGDKRKIQQAAAQGLVDPTSAVLAGMFIDRIRNAAAAEQAPQATVAEQVMNPQPQMPSAGLAATPQAAQMQQPMPPRMPQPGAPQMPQPTPPQMAQAPQMPPQQPQGMAMGGGLDSIDFVEQAYAPGGMVSFQVGGGYGETMAQLRQQLASARTQAQRDQIQAAMNQLRAQYEQSTFAPNMSAGPAREVAPVASAGDPMAIGMEGFAEGVVPRPPQGERIDPNRFDTGTLTEEEAMRIAEEGRVPMFPENAGQPLFEFGDKLGRFLGGRKIVAPEDRVGLAELVAGRNVKVGTDESSTQGAASEGDGENASFLERLANFRGLDNKGMTLREKVSDPGRYFRDETAFGRPFRGGEPTPDAYTGATMPVEQTTDAANQFVEQPEDDQFGTIANQIAAEQEAARETPPAAGAETETLPSFSNDFNALQEQMKGIMPQTEYGEYRKKFDQMVKDSKGTMERGRKDAFNMALLQAGLGMMAQGGGQTALQALGKAALPATKQYMDTVKDLKKEDQELFKLGLSLEKMDAQERNATFRTMASLVGQRRAADLQYKAALLNAERLTGEERMVDNIYLPRAKELFPNLSPAAQAQKAAGMYFEDRGMASLAGVGQRATATEASVRETALGLADEAIGYGGTNRREYQKILREQGADAAEQYKDRIFNQILQRLSGGAGSAGGGNAGQSGGSGLSQEDQALVNQYLQ